MEITFLGGGNEIGASSALVDCGVRMSGENVLPDFGLLAARELSAVDVELPLSLPSSVPACHSARPASSAPYVPCLGEVPHPDTSALCH